MSFARPTENRSKRVPAFWEDRDIGWFFLIQIFGFGAFGLRSTILPLYVYHQTGSATALGAVAAIQYLASAIFGLFGGLISDHFDRRAYLRLANAARVVIFGSFALLAAMQHLTLPIIYVGLVLMGMTSTASTEFAAMTYLLPAERRGKGAALIANGDNLAQILGYAAGGALFGLIGGAASISAVAACYAVTMVCSLPIRHLGPDARKARLTAAHAISEFGAGIRFIVSSRIVLGVMSISVVAGGLCGGVSALLIPYLTDVFHASAVTIGAFGAAGAIGTIVGMMLAGRTGDRESYGRPLVTASILLVAALAGLVLVHAGEAFTLVCWSLAMAAFSAQSVLCRMWQVRTIPSEIGGRVMGNVGVLASLAMMGSTWACGSVAQAAGVSAVMQFAMCVASVILVSAAALALLVHPRSARIPR